MKILVMLGSRDPEGRTAEAAGRAAEGFMSESNEAEFIYLPERAIQRCMQCGPDGWGSCKTEGRCVIDDDFQPLFEKLTSVPVLIFATPVYFSDLSESMKGFLDRLRRVSRNDNGRRAVSGKTALGICVAGGGGGGAYNCAAGLEKVLANCGFYIADIIPVRRQNFDLKLNVLEQTGRWLPLAVDRQRAV